MHVYIIKVSVLKTEEGFLEKVMEKHVLKKFYGLTSPEFDRENYYGGSDLGLSFEKDKVIFKIWSPIADTVTVRLYHDLNNNSISDREITLDKENAGVWTCMISSKYIGWAYDYKFTFCDGTVTYANDPYAVAATINGVRSVIIDIAKIEVNDLVKLPSFTNPTDAIIYETSVRDITADENGGFKYPGLFLGLSEKNTHTAQGYATGLSYLKSLGITHVQLLPMFDFGSLDEADPNHGYNWGYDPINYNVPEGTYSTDPADPVCRIKEMKYMVNELHRAGIRVVMDVVYNHVFDIHKQAFEQVVPGYYFKHDEKGNMIDDIGMGNAIASQRLMVRKYIVDSIIFWIKNYHIDGFRFDTMGVLDVDTMNLVVEEAHKIDPGILIYGEGWNIKPIERPLESGHDHASLMPNVGFFGENLRNAVIGESGEYADYRPGLVQGNLAEVGASGKKYYEQDVCEFVKGFMGSNGFHTYIAPHQLINYSTCHDNFTLYDALIAHLPNASRSEIIKRAEMSLAMILLAEGVPLIHSGQECLRTKNGNVNSYNAPIEENKIDWLRVEQNQDLIEFFKKLVNIRKKYSIFRIDDYQEISCIVRPYVLKQNGIFAFEYTMPTCKLYVLFNIKNETQLFNQIDLTGAKVILSNDNDLLLSQHSTLGALTTSIVIVK